MYLHCLTQYYWLRSKIMMPGLNFCFCRLSHILDLVEVVAEGSLYFAECVNLGHQFTVVYLSTNKNGHTIEEVAKLKVDGVSGATFSSKAIIGNVQRGVQYVANNPLK